MFIIPSIFVNILQTDFAFPGDRGLLSDLAFGVKILGVFRISSWLSVTVAVTTRWKPLQLQEEIYFVFECKSSAISSLFKTQHEKYIMF